MSIYINPDGTLPLNEAGQPMVIDRDQYRSQCCCECPCEDWPSIFESGSCCGLLSSYVVNFGEFQDSFGVRYRVVDPITVNVVSEDFPCRWFGTGGKVESFGRGGWGDFFFAPAGAQILRPVLSNGRCFWRLDLGATEIGDSIVFRFSFTQEIGDDRPVGPPIGTYTKLDGGTATVS